MGLYLCVFDEDDEVDGIDIGSYADFNALRNYVVRTFELEGAGERFPTLILHSDCDGIWSVEDCKLLQDELMIIKENLKRLPPIQFNSDWQATVAKSIGLKPSNA